MGQVNENDNNKNRKYQAVDTRIARTYAQDSKATLKNKLSDPYVKAIRWATDRIGTQGLVCFVSNNGFIDNMAFDGMRAHLERDFDALYVLNLHGNIRKDSMRDRIPLGERHTVFGLAAMVGISVSFMVRNGGKKKGVFYSECDFRSTRQEKFNLLANWASATGVPWKTIKPDKNHNWLTWEEQQDFTTFYPIGDQDAKAGSKTARAFFEIFSLGVVTSRDSWVYSFSAPTLLENVKRLAAAYNSEVGRLRQGTANGKNFPMNLNGQTD